MRMPALFVGHGSPMIALEENHYTKEWQKIGEMFKPKAILMISAHWYTYGNLTQNEENPKKINDMYGFPRELYEMKYDAVGDSVLTSEIEKALGKGVIIDNKWGIDHGAWVVLVHMYPNANIPIVQLSVDSLKTPDEQFEIGKKINHLRDQGYMIIASGNIVHNLKLANFSQSKPYTWAMEFDDYIQEAIENKDYDKCINYLELGESARLSVPTPDHYYPLLNLLGAISEEDKLTVFNKGYDFGGISMTSYLYE